MAPKENAEVFMLSKLFGLFAISALLSVRAFASPIIIQYDLSNVSANTYIYTYSITNNGSLPGNANVQLFDIFFDPTLYLDGSLVVVTPQPLASQWSEFIFPAIGATPDDFDAESLGAGIPVNATVRGFAVEFTWLGQGLPGSQSFTVTDPNNISQPLQSGTTGAATPEPGTFWGVGALLAFGVRLVRKKRVSQVYSA